MDESSEPASGPPRGDPKAVESVALLMLVASLLVLPAALLLWRAPRRMRAD